MQVIKRDGRLKEMDFSRIERAIDNAFIEVYSEGQDYTDKINQVLMNISDTILSLNLSKNIKRKY